MLAKLERLAEMRDYLADGTRFSDERDQPDVAAAPRALQRKPLPHPCHQFRPRNRRRVVRAGLLIRVTAASRGVVVARMNFLYRSLFTFDVKMPGLIANDPLA